MNNMRKYFYIIFSSIIFIGCDFDEIEPFQMPAWNWPLSFPLLDENYTFAEMGVIEGEDGIYYNASGDTAVNNNIFFDEVDSTLFIEFSANLLGEDGTKVGVDESFSSYFEIEAPPFDADALGSIALPSITSPSTTVPVGIPLYLGMFLYPVNEDVSDPFISATALSCDFFPTTGMFGSEGFSKDSTFSTPIYSLESINDAIDGGSLQFTSIEKITFDQGSVVVSIENNYPFKVDLTEITFTSNGQQLFLNDSNQNTFRFNDIEPGTSIEQEFIINADNVIDFGESLDIQFNYFVDNLAGTGEANPYPTGDLCRSFAIEGWYLCDLELVSDNPSCDQNLDGYCDPVEGECSVSGVEYDPWAESIFDVDISFSITNAKSITGQMEIEPITEIIAIPMQETEGIQIVGGHLVESVIPGINSLNLDIENNMFTPIDFKMEFSNFYNRDLDTLGIDTLISIGGQLQHQIPFHDYYLGHSDSSGVPIDSIIVKTEFALDDSENITFLLDGGYELKINDISFENIKLEYVTAATQELSFETPSINIDNIPSGFEGFEFADLKLEFNVYNQIGIPVSLQLELTGNKQETGESVSINIDPQLSYNIVDADSNVFLDDNASLQDSAWTKIILDKNGQTTYQYVLNEDKTDYELLQSDFPGFENPKIEEKEVTILDVMTIAPDELLVSGGAWIEGQGVLAPSTYVWGGFTMEAPLSFIFSQAIQFIPAAPTVLAPMDTTTINKIDSSLVVAKLNLDITNSIPIAGNIGLLISDYNSSLCEGIETCLENYFPVYLDSLISNDLSAQSGEISIDDQSIFEQDLNFLQDLDIVEIKVYNLQNEIKVSKSEETLYLNFLDSNGNIVFMIGRIFNLGIEAPDEIDPQTGFSLIPSHYVEEIELDTTRIDWITSEVEMFMMPMITFNNTESFYCEDGSECNDDKICTSSGDECLREPRTFQTTNSIDIDAFITFTLNTGSLFESKKTIKLVDKNIGAINN